MGFDVWEAPRGAGDKTATIGPGEGTVRLAIGHRGRSLSDLSASDTEHKGAHPRLRVGSEQTRSLPALARFNPTRQLSHHRGIGEAEMPPEANGGTAISLITSWWLIPSCAYCLCRTKSKSISDKVAQACVRQERYSAKLLCLWELCPTFGVLSCGNDLSSRTLGHRDLYHSSIWSDTAKILFSSALPILLALASLSHTSKPG